MTWDEVPVHIKDEVQQVLIALRITTFLTPRHITIQKCLDVRKKLEFKYPILKEVFPPLPENYK